MKENGINTKNLIEAINTLAHLIQLTGIFTEAQHLDKKARKLLTS